ncbi:MAG: (4Fe-4S)-binding protein [Hyphomonadaceae bacterium]
MFLANVEGPWIHPNTMDAEKLVAIAEICPSGAIRHHRNDGRPEEAAPPVNLAVIREGGPYAVRCDIVLVGKRQGFRMTLCRLEEQAVLGTIAPRRAFRRFRRTADGQGRHAGGARRPACH